MSNIDLPCKKLPQNLTISFWLWALWDTPPGGVYHDLDRRFAELRERGFNCVRLDSGAGLIHDAAGNLRGPIAVTAVAPGWRELRQLGGYGEPGSCDLAKRLIALFEAAKRHDAYIILSSWFYLHTYWIVGDDLARELTDGLAPEKRYDHFARALDNIINLLKAHNLHDRIAFAEIFNEADGLPFVKGYGPAACGPATLHRYRELHEEAIDFLRSRHPDVLFGCDTYTPYTEAELFPRNIQVWNFHSYYAWPVYELFENNLLNLKLTADPEAPAALAPARQYLRQSMRPLTAVREARAGRLPLPEGWYRRIWLFDHLDLVKLPDLEQRLAAQMVLRSDEFYENVRQAVAAALQFQAKNCPQALLVMGEGTTYCASPDMRWEECSDAYWQLLDRASGLLRDSRVWGTTVRTNSGADDPAWSEFPERLLAANRHFSEH